MMIAILYGEDEEDLLKIQSQENFAVIEKRYGKEFLKLLKRTVDKDLEKKLTFSEVLDEIHSLIKLKGTDELLTGNEKKRKNPNSVIHTWTGGGKDVGVGSYVGGSHVR